MSSYPARESAESPEVDFTTLGMFILDKIHFGDSEELAIDNVIGGAGTFGIPHAGLFAERTKGADERAGAGKAVIGARLFSPGPLAKSIGWIVDAGYDFPPEIRETLDSLGTRLKMREDPGRQTTRGWNKYGPGDHREFRYLTPKRRLEAADLVAGGLVAAKTIHLICSPLRAKAFCDQVHGALGGQPALGKPRFIWEPVPDLCTPEHRIDMFKTLQLVHVVSPNHEELAHFFGIEDPLDINDPKVIQDLAGKLVAAGIGPSGDGGVVVRAGKMGCLVVSQKDPPIWLPAYYQPTEDHENNPKVVDPTGGGNAFIGGFAVGLSRKGITNYTYAAAMGTVAASFAIEQVGIPGLGKAHNSGDELWNDVSVAERFEGYRRRIKGMGTLLE